MTLAPCVSVWGQTRSLSLSKRRRGAPFDKLRACFAPGLKCTPWLLPIRLQAQEHAILHPARGGLRLNRKIGLLIILLLVLVVVAVIAGSCLRGLAGDPAAIWTPAPAMAGSPGVTPGAAILPTLPPQPTRTPAPPRATATPAAGATRDPKLHHHHRGRRAERGRRGCRRAARPDDRRVGRGVHRWADALDRRPAELRPG